MIFRCHQVFLFFQPIKNVKVILSSWPYRNKQWVGFDPWAVAWRPWSCSPRWAHLLFLSSLFTPFQSLWLLLLFCKPAKLVPASWPLPLLSFCCPSAWNSSPSAVPLTGNLLRIIRVSAQMPTLQRPFLILHLQADVSTPAVGLHFSSSYHHLKQFYLFTS